MNQKKANFSSFISSSKMLKHVFFSGLLEFGPVIIFLVSSQYQGIYGSTVLLMVATIVSTIVTYQLQKRIPYMALYVATITIIFGYKTLHLHSAKFIQMRDTLYDATCALTLIIGVIINVPFLKIVFHKALPMTNRAWNNLTYLWIGYFLFIALSNEVVRRIFSLSDWLFFKGVIVFTTSLFGLLTVYFCYEEENGKN